ncbi:MAG: hypothetical protein LBS81_02260 [Endomicrobium sp.]|nr:hypothetical protein [Endomicrobium sp.]
MCRLDPVKYGELNNSLDHISFCNFNIIIGAGGMNNEIYFAGKICDSIYDRNEDDVLLPYVVYLN